MGKVNFDNLDEVMSTTSTDNGNDIGFFTLKNDGDEAIVRFICDSTQDFDIRTVHSISIGNNRYRKVNCIRDPRDPIDKCPLCANGTQISTRFFIRLIQYNKVSDPQTGAIHVVPKAMIWERSVSYAKTLKSYLDNYGPMSDVICKIIRHGGAGDMKTTYEIVPNLSKAIYRDDIYVKDPTLFGTFDTLGTIVMNKDYNELDYFVKNGKFPAQDNSNSNAEAAAPKISNESANTYNNNPSISNNSYTPTNYEDTYQTTPQFDPDRISPRTRNFEETSTTQNPVSGFERPRRY